MLPALAGVDGCRAGWIAVVRRPGEAPAVRVHPSFETLVDALPADAVVAVDMPVGLPERIEGSGRAAEKAARPLLGARRSSLFSIPARGAVELDPGPHAGEAERGAAHARAGAFARALSDPPRGISRQGFMLFPKILEIDRLLRRKPELAWRVVESHPELAFARLNGGVAMSLPKKAKGRIHPPGMAERRALLVRHGLPPALLAGPPPRGAGRDDLLDASAMLLVAERFARGDAVSHPDPPERDAFGLPIAIWV